MQFYAGRSPIFWPILHSRNDFYLAQLFSQPQYCISIYEKYKFILANNMPISFKSSYPYQNVKHFTKINLEVGRFKKPIWLYLSF